ncbi:MAG: transglutaminase-like domain-containing protein, partial [Saprospiraceae bacterium]|nr:transglutaminase-like domain-containing protein [Saprospiraceae bacterium]
MIKQVNFPKKAIWILLLLTSIQLSSFSQVNLTIDTGRVQRKAKRARRFAFNPEKLAKSLTANYSDDERKVIAITYWITKNINYRYNAYVSRSIKGLTSKQVLKTRKALCGEYAQLFKDMCEAVDVKAEIVNGYTTDFDLFPDDTLYWAEHAWSIVSINGKWYLMDLTWGSGYIKQKKQYVRRFLWWAFNISYERKFKYVHSLNPNWFYVKPEIMVHSHLPNLKMFQLLSVPVPIDSFIVGNSAIKDFIDLNNSIESQNSEIEQFVNSSSLNKNLYEAENGYITNRKNHRVKGFNYYLAADSLISNSLNPKTKLIDGPESLLDEIKSYCQIADSFLLLSIKDNKREFSNYHQRSINWKTDLKGCNNLIKKSLRTRKKLNQKQYKLIRKIKVKNRSAIHYFTLTSKRFNNISINIVNRPRTKLFSDSVLSSKYIKMADSIYGTSLNSIKIKDSLFQFYSQSLQDSLVEFESRNLELHYENFRNLRSYVQYKKVFLPWIYFSDSPIKKEWFSSILYYADSLNKSFTDTVLVGLYKSQKMAYYQMKEYSKSSKKALKLLKLAKKKSVYNQDEDSLFYSYMENFQLNFSEYTKQVEDNLMPNNKLANKLKMQSRFLKKSDTKLNKDNLLENSRHTQYMFYRISIKKAEDKRMRYVRRKVG